MRIAMQYGGTGIALARSQGWVCGVAVRTTEGKDRGTKVAAKVCGKGAEYFLTSHESGTAGWDVELYWRWAMSILQKLIATLQHRTESAPKFDQNLRAEDGFVRPSQRGFLRIY
ncbi:MAG TPA: hypothetical protein VGM11_09890 [Acidobacteriaceae bacterium]|jgi:hypothetical protein